MADLFWPGDDRAGEHFTDAAYVEAMVVVEQEWLDLLVGLGVAPPTALAAFAVGGARELEWLGNESELTGSPVPGLLELLREHPDTPPEAARWLHRGLTSQDVVDTALMLMAAAAVAEVLGALRQQVEALAELAREHRGTPMVGRTLTQHAVPVTFGLVAAQWLAGVLDARDDLARLGFPVQVGGAAGTLAALVELGVQDPRGLVAALAGRLGLATGIPWHTTRSPVTRIADGLVRCTDAWGRIAADVLTLGRPELGEVTDGSGGGSSTMPGKANPVLAVLVKRAALTAPGLGATLHLAAASAVDQRPDGAWHAEWATLRDLVRRSLVAAEHTTELLSGLRVDAARMARTLAADGVPGEQRVMAELAGHAPAGDYLGIAGQLVDDVLARAGETP